MKYDEDKYEWVLDSGKRFYSHTDMIGIGADLDGTGDDIGYGADGGFPSNLTKAEKIEIADEMIARWKRFKKLAQKPTKQI